MFKNKDKMTKKQFIGQIGENVASRHLETLNFEVLDKNYRKKWGEIDIICVKDEVIHFVEVKTVSRNLKNVLKKRSGEEDDYRPEENVHSWKIKRLHRAISTYLLEKKYLDNQDWVLDLVVVYLDLNTKKAKINYIKNIC